MPSKPKYERIPLQEFHGGSESGSDDEKPDTSEVEASKKRRNPDEIGGCCCCRRKKKSDIARAIVLAVVGTAILCLFAVVAIRLGYHRKTPSSKDGESQFTERKRKLLDRYCRSSNIDRLPELKPGSDCPSSGSLSGLRTRVTWKAEVKPELISESPVRFVDVNCDGILDTLVGYGMLKADGKRRKVSLLKECLEADQGTLDFCYGGVMALNGKTGSILWQRMTPDEIFAISCEIDLNGDGDSDCFIGGRRGSLAALERHTGQAIWVANAVFMHPTWNFLTPQATRDYDGDGLADIVVSHGGNPMYRFDETHRETGLLCLFSSRNGEALSVMSMPDGKETYMSPVLHQSASGREQILFGSGGETIGGSLWSVDADQFASMGLHVKADNFSREVFRGMGKGVMNPPVIADLTGDGIEDVVLASFDGRLVLLDGRDYHQVWSVDFGKVETYAQPALGRYNDDDVLDVMVIYHRGAFHLHYSGTVMAVVDGKSGKLLLEESSTVSILAQSSPLVVRMASGHDVFLYWRQTEVKEDHHKFHKRHGGSEESHNDDEDDDGSVIVSRLMAMADSNATLYETSMQKAATVGPEFSSTPGIADVDGNGKLDVVVVHSVAKCSPRSIKDNKCKGTGQLLQIFQMELDFMCPTQPLEDQTWLGYMGTFTDSRSSEGTAVK